MRRRWIVALALAAVALALTDPLRTVYIMANAHSAHSVMPVALAGPPLLGLPGTLATCLSVGAAVAAATLAARSRRWWRFAALLAVLVLFLGGLNPVGTVVVYFAVLPLAAANPMSDPTGGDLALLVVLLAAPQLITALAALLWAVFPGRPRVPAMSLGGADLPPAVRPGSPASPMGRVDQGRSRSAQQTILLFACAIGLLLACCLLITSAGAP